MYTSKLYILLAVVLASVFPILAAPSLNSPTHDTAVPKSSKLDSSVPQSTLKSHHNKAIKKKGVKNLSRRSPFHSEVLLRRDVNGPAASASSLLDAATCLNSDQGAIHKSLLLLQRDRSLGRSNDFHKRVSDQLAQWQKHANTIPELDSIHQSLSQFGREKGMANLDKGSDAEVVLKNLINTVKYTMADVNLIVYIIPILGPLLGPIVYQIKCIVDDLLNGLENTTDGLLNDLGIARDFQLCSLLTNLREFC